MSSRFPIFWGQQNIKIYPNTEIFFTPSLYENLKTKMTFGLLITLTDLETFNFFTLLSIKTLIKHGHLMHKILF